MLGDVEIVVKREGYNGKPYDIFRFVKDVPASCVLGGCDIKAKADVKYYAERYDFSLKFWPLSSDWKEFGISADMYSSQYFLVSDIEDYATIFDLQSETCCSGLMWDNWCAPDR